MKKENKRLKLNITAARVGDHYMKNCERFTAYSLLKDPTKIGWHERDHRHTASQEAGHIWEWDVLSKLQEDGIGCYAEAEYSDESKADQPAWQVTDFGDMRIKCDIFSGARGEDAVAYADLTVEKTLEILRDPATFLPGYAEGKTAYIYQATIECPEGFREKILLRSKEYRDFLEGVFSKDEENKDEVLEATWNICKPDLILAEPDEKGEPVYSIVDIKHAKHARMGHKVQVAIYAELLAALIEDKGLPGRVDREKGYLWNFRMDKPHAFELKSVRPWILDYFERILPETMLRLKQCLGSKEEDAYNTEFSACPGIQCEWCDNFDTCRVWQIEHEPVTMMPYLSAYAQRYLRETGVPLDIDGFKNYVRDPENEERLKRGNLGLKRILSNKEENIKALAKRCKGEKQGAVLRKNISYMGMPRSEKVRILLTAQRDEASDNIYALGIRISVKGTDEIAFSTECFQRESKIITTEEGDVEFITYRKVWIAEEPEQTPTVIRDFLEAVYDVLKTCSDSNVGREDIDKLTVQGYVMDQYEYLNIEDALMDELLNGDGAENEDYRKVLLEILFWLHGERAVTDVEEQAASMNEGIPIVVIGNAVRSLFSIPAEICYDLKSVSDALLPGKEDRDAFLRIERYHHKLSNTVKSEVIDTVWSGKTKTPREDINGLRQQLEIRMYIEDRLIGKIRELARDALKGRAVKYRLNAMNPCADVWAAKLWTECQYEEFKKYHEIRNVRMSEPEEMVAEGEILKLRLLEKAPIEKKFFPRFGGMEKKQGFRCRFKLINDESFFKSGFFLGVLLRAQDENVLADLRTISKAQEDLTLPHSLQEDISLPYHHLYSADGIDLISDEQGRFVVLEIFEGSDVFRPGEEFYLYESYKDLNTKKVDAALKNIEDDVCTHLHPERFYSDAIVTENGQNRTADETDLEECLQYRPAEANADFTDSQRQAFRQLFLKNITLLLGPPGTGKTDFIARAVITLCKYFAAKGRLFSVLVCANSHSAMNNILEKLSGKNADGALALYKIDKWGDAAEPAVDGVSLARDFDSTAVPIRNVLSYSAQKPFVTGCSCWQITKTVSNYNKYRKGLPEFGGYDLIVIDEASQMRTMDALISLQAGREDHTTRYLIVGDEDQLPPIIQGKYNAEGQEVDIYGSIFRLFYDSARAGNLDYKVQLKEQFRMNEILCRYSAETIYQEEDSDGSGRDYYAFDYGKVREGGVALQKLSLTSIPEDPVISLLTDPEYPLVVCRIHSGDAYVKRNEEIRLVTQLVETLREKMCIPGTNQPYNEDASFWGGPGGDGGLGIISPHHEQINLLKDEIVRTLGMDREKCFIDTVDKLQGRQREVVIVSYGVTDPEKAAAEMEFIYSRNRLNVAITRGKKKVICILSDTLLDRSVETLSVDDEDTLKGVNFMTGLLDYMKEEVEDEEASVSTDLDLGNVKMDVYRKRIK